MGFTVEYISKQPHFKMGKSASIMNRRFGCMECKVIHKVEMNGKAWATLSMSDNLNTLTCATEGCDNVIATWITECTCEQCNGDK